MDTVFWAFSRDNYEKPFWDNILEFLLAFVIIFSFTPTNTFDNKVADADATEIYA